MMSIMSVGYEGLSLEEFIDRLRTEGVKALADIRLSARSRKPGFSKSRLAEALARASITYHHFPALGNPKENREPFWTGRGLDAALARYRAHIQSEAASSALERIASLATEAPVAVLCFEADEEQCHRQIVVEQLRTVPAWSSGLSGSRRGQ